MFTKKCCQLHVTVKFPCSLTYATQFLDSIFEFNSQTKNTKKMKTKITVWKRTQEHWYFVNVADKLHISVYQAYIQDETRGTSHPLKIIDHQINHFESI